MIRRVPGAFMAYLAQSPDDVRSFVSRILLIEDDDRIRTSMRLALQDEGHDVGGLVAVGEAVGVEVEALVGPEVLAVLVATLPHGGRVGDGDDLVVPHVLG